MDPGWARNLGLSSREELADRGFDTGPADVVAIGVFGATVDTGAADDLKLVSACCVVVESGVRRPEAVCNTRGGSQKPDIPPVVQVDQVESSSYTSEETNSKGLHGSYVNDSPPSLAM